MFPTNRSDPQWVQQLLERAVAERWCTKINCSTCGAQDLRHAIGLIEIAPDGGRRHRPMSRELVEAIVAGLKVSTSKSATSNQMEEAVRWMLYEVWRSFGDENFSTLDGTWAGDVLAGMQAHYQRRQEARRLHDARQGVKIRDWKN